MKRESLGWFVAGAVIVLTCTLGAMQQQGGVGRFQLFEGRHLALADNTSIVFETVWRIDTETGETLYFVADPGAKNGIGDVNGVSVPIGGAD